MKQWNFWDHYESQLTEKKALRKCLAHYTDNCLGEFMGLKSNRICNRCKLTRPGVWELDNKMSKEDEQCT